MPRKKANTTGKKDALTAIAPSANTFAALMDDEVDDMVDEVQKTTKVKKVNKVDKAKIIDENDEVDMDHGNDEIDEVESDSDVFLNSTPRKFGSNSSQKKTQSKSDESSKSNEVAKAEPEEDGWITVGSKKPQGKNTKNVSNSKNASNKTVVTKNAKNIAKVTKVTKSVKSDTMKGETDEGESDSENSDESNDNSNSGSDDEYQHNNDYGERITKVEKYSKNDDNQNRSKMPQDKFQDRSRDRSQDRSQTGSHSGSHSKYVFNSSRLDIRNRDSGKEKGKYNRVSKPRPYSHQKPDDRDLDDAHFYNPNEIKSNKGDEMSLNTPWKVWVHSNNSSDWGLESYDSGSKLESVGQMLRFLYDFESLNKRDYQYFVMRNEIAPIWEDINNKDGVITSIKINLGNRDDSLDIGAMAFKVICMLVLNESFVKNNTDINGVCFSIKNNSPHIKLWVKDRAQNSAFEKGLPMALLRQFETLVESNRRYNSNYYRGGARPVSVLTRNIKPDE